MIDQLYGLLLSLSPYWLYLAAGALAAIENVFPPFPSDVGIAIIAFLAGRGQLDAGGVFGCAWTGNVVAGALMYFVARRYGRGLLRSRFGRRLISEGSLSRIELATHRHAGSGVFLMRLLPGWRGVVPLAAGITGLPPLTTIFSIGAASAVWYGLLVFGVAEFGTSLEAIRAALEGVDLVLGLLAGAVLLGFAFWLWKLARRQRLG